MLVVWRNDECSVCKAGARRQRDKLRRLVAEGKIDFREIDLESDGLARFGIGIGVDDVRRRLRAVDDEDRQIVGADVVLAVWRLTPGEGWLAALLGAPPLLPSTRLAYDRFADLLFVWNERAGGW